MISSFFILGATKKICTFILKIENGAKSDFRSYSKLVKDQNSAEIYIEGNLT